ncbi:MAG: single-stranded DNA-binding protein [Bacteroidia bacterium]
MNAIKNRVQLVGNLGGSPEVKTLTTGNKVARFSLATSESYFNSAGQKITETYWHNVVAWGKLAGIAESLLQKGSEVAIDGKLITRTYNDRTGLKKYVTEVVASELLLLTKKEAAAPARPF